MLKEAILRIQDIIHVPTKTVLCQQQPRERAAEAGSGVVTAR